MIPFGVHARPFWGMVSVWTGRGPDHEGDGCMWPFARRPKMSKQEQEALRVAKAKAAEDRAEQNAREPAAEDPQRT